MLPLSHSLKSFMLTHKSKVKDTSQLPLPLGIFGEFADIMLVMQAPRIHAWGPQPGAGAPAAPPSGVVGGGADVAGARPPQSPAAAGAQMPISAA